MITYVYADTHTHANRELRPVVVVVVVEGGCGEVVRPMSRVLCHHARTTTRRIGRTTG